MRDRGLDRAGRGGLHPQPVHQPRQIYASAADRRHGRRWSGVRRADRRGRRWSGVDAAGRRRARRHRSYWTPAAVLAVALAAGEALRSLA
jgi:hypothetical protein